MGQALLLLHKMSSQNAGNWGNSAVVKLADGKREKRQPRGMAYMALEAWSSSSVDGRQQQRSHTTSPLDICSLDALAPSQSVGAVAKTM